MFRRNRHKRWLVAGLGVAALVVPTGATAGGFSKQYGPADGWYGYAVSLTKQQQKQNRSVDSWYGYAVSLTSQQKQSTVIDGRSPDTIDAGLAAQAVQSTPADGRSPDTRDAAFAAQSIQSASVDGRSPDTIDFASQAHSPVVTVVSTPGFQWGDFGIGGAVALGVLLLLSMSLRLVSSRKDGKQRPLVTT